MASAEQWGPGSLKEALKLMKDLLRNGYNPAGIVREGIDASLVRTCCQQLGIAFVEHDLLSADAERRGQAYGASASRPLTQQGARTTSRSGSSARASTSRTSPAPVPTGRKRKQREEAPSSDVIVVDDSSDNDVVGPIAGSSQSAIQASAGRAQGSSSNGHIPQAQQASSSAPRREPTGAQRSVPTAASNPPSTFQGIPAPGQKLTKGQKKARQRDFERQMEAQRRAGITFQVPPPLPPGYVRPDTNANVESAVYKVTEPAVEDPSRPLPSWLRSSGSTSLPSSLPARPAFAASEQQASASTSASSKTKERRARRERAAQRLASTSSSELPSSVSQPQASSRSPPPNLPSLDADVDMSTCASVVEAHSADEVAPQDARQIPMQEMRCDPSNSGPNGAEAAMAKDIVSTQVTSVRPVEHSAQDSQPSQVSSSAVLVGTSATGDEAQVSTDNLSEPGPPAIPPIDQATSKTARRRATRKANSVARSQDGSRASTSFMSEGEDGSGGDARTKTHVSVLEFMNSLPAANAPSEPAPSLSDAGQGPSLQVLDAERDSLALMRQAALASMLGKRKKGVEGGAVAETVPSTIQANVQSLEQPEATTSVPGPSRKRAEMDAPQPAEASVPILDYNDQDSVSSSDAGIGAHEWEPPAPSSSRKQVSYADPFPDTARLRALARRKKAMAGIDIPSGGVDADMDELAIDAAQGPGPRPPQAPAGSGSRRGERPRAADLFHGSGGDQDPVRRKRVRRAPFLELSVREERKYGTIELGDESDGDESYDDEGTTRQGTQSAPATRQTSPESSKRTERDTEGRRCPSWQLQGEALRRNHLQEVDNIVGLLRQGRTPTLASLRPHESGPAGVVIQRAASAGALGQTISPDARPPRTAPHRHASPSDSRPPMSRSHSQVAGPTLERSTSSSFNANANASANTVEESSESLAAQQAEIRAKLAAYEANIKMMKEQMARLEEAHARKKAMEIVQRRRAAASRSSEDVASTLEVHSGEALQHGASAERSDHHDVASTSPDNTSSNTPDDSMTMNTAAQPMDLGADKPLELSPSPEPHDDEDEDEDEPQDGEVYIPEDDDALEPEPAMPPPLPPPQAQTQQPPPPPEGEGMARSSSRWTPYVSPLSVFPSLRRLADGQ